MLKSFLLVFNNSQLERRSILEYFDTIPSIKNWYAFLPTAVFIISAATAFQLSELFRNKFPNNNFVITEVPRGANDGWLDKAAWDFINNPKSSGRWP